MQTCTLNEALPIFEDILPEIRKSCVQNAEAVVERYTPYQELDVDQPITSESIHLHVNYLQLQAELKPILTSIRRIDNYRWAQDHPNRPERVTDSDIQRAREADADWFIEQAGLSTRRPHKGLCPFHNDSNASLTLMQSRAKGTLYLKCFVCNRAWDSLAYIMERDKVEFIDAVNIVNRVWL